LILPLTAWVWVLRGGSTVYRIVCTFYRIDYCFRQRSGFGHRAACGKHRTFFPTDNGMGRDIDTGIGRIYKPGSFDGNRVCGAIQAFKEGHIKNIGIHKKTRLIWRFN
jgi:hypothetical protein